MKSLWEKLNDATQPGNAALLAEIAAELNYTGREPVLYVLKRAQRLAGMKGKRINTEAELRFWFAKADGNLAAQFGVGA